MHPEASWMGIGVEASWVGIEGEVSSTAHLSSLENVAVVVLHARAHRELVSSAQASNP
jgi:hypothetical protein